MRVTTPPASLRTCLSMVIQTLTTLAIAAGLKRTTEDNAYSRLLVSRPIMPLGRDLGFLPGDVDEKLNPWMQPIFDNLEFLFSNGGAKAGHGSRGFLELLENGTVQVEPLTYIRGRSLPHQYLIVDLSAGIAGAYCTKILADGGAEVSAAIAGHACRRVINARHSVANRGKLMGFRDRLRAISGPGCEPVESEASQADVFPGFVQAKHGLVREDREVGIGASLGIQRSMDRPGPATIAAELNREVLAPAASAGNFASIRPERQRMRIGEKQDT